MRAVFRHLLTCAVLAWQVAGGTIRVDAGADSSTYTLAGAAPRELGASIRLTQYDLPASAVYYLPAGSPRVKKTVNQTRPLANGYPAGWKLLFYPAALSQSNKRWLVYDDKGHFQSYDTVDGEDGVVDYYDYDETEPAGCQRGLEARFVLGGIPSSTAWADIPVNKAAFWVDPAAAALYSGTTTRDGETGAGATSVQPILCRAVPARISASDGGVFGVFPIASIALAALIVFMALLSLLLLCCSACLRKQTSSTQKGYHSTIPLTTR